MRSPYFTRAYRRALLLSPKSGERIVDNMPDIILNKGLMSCLRIGHDAGGYFSSDSVMNQEGSMKIAIPPLPHHGT